MPDAKHTAELLEKVTSPGAPREKYSKEWQTSGRRAVDLELRYKNGRQREGLSWMLYRRRQWVDTGGEHECLRLLFDDVVVTIEGYQLAQLEEELKLERLEVIQERDAPTATLHHGGATHEVPVTTRYVVTKITVEPDFDSDCEEARQSQKEVAHGHDAARYPKH